MVPATVVVVRPNRVVRRPADRLAVKRPEQPCRRLGSVKERRHLHPVPIADGERAAIERHVVHAAQAEAVGDVVRAVVLHPADVRGLKSEPIGTKPRCGPADGALVVVCRKHRAGEARVTLDAVGADSPVRLEGRRRARGRGLASRQRVLSKDIGEQLVAARVRHDAVGNLAGGDEQRVRILAEERRGTCAEAEGAAAAEQRLGRVVRLRQFRVPLDPDLPDGRGVSAPGTQPPDRLGWPLHVPTWTETLQKPRDRCRPVLVASHPLVAPQAPHGVEQRQRLVRGALAALHEDALAAKLLEEVVEGHDFREATM